MTDDAAVSAVDKAISELVNFDLVVVENSHAKPSTYIQRHRHEYIRTVRDILATASPTTPKRVLEIGSFFGVVCMALKFLDTTWSLPTSRIPRNTRTTKRTPDTN